MNKIFKVIWSKSRNCYVVASELAKGTSKSTSTGRMAKRAALAAVAALLISPLGAGYVSAADDYVTVKDTKGTEQTVYTKDGVDTQLSEYAKNTTVIQNTNDISDLKTADANEKADREAADTEIRQAMTDQKTSTALHVTTAGNLVVGTKENQVVKNMKINGQLTSGSLSTGDITSTGDVSVAGKVEAEAVYDDTTKTGNYVVQTNSVGANLSALDTQVKSNANAIEEEARKRKYSVTNLENADKQLQTNIDNEAAAREAADTALDTRITNVKEYLQQEAADTYVSKDDAAVQDGAIVKAANTIGDNVTKLDAALAKETADRLGADAAQDKVIQQVNDNLVASVNTINESVKTTNENMAAGFTALSQADANEAATREAADTEIKQAMTDQKTSTALHVSKDGNLIVGTKENQVVKNMKINGQLTSGSLSTGDITSTGDVSVAGKVEAEAVYDDTTKTGNYVVQTNSVGANLSALDTQVKSNANAIEEEARKRKYSVTNLENADKQLQTNIDNEAAAREAADTALDTRTTALEDKTEAITYDKDSKTVMVDGKLTATEGITDGTTQDGQYVKGDNYVGQNLNALDQGLQAETAAREAADTTLQTNIDKEAAERKAADAALDDKITAETSARVAADTKLVEAVNSGLSLSNDNVLQKNTTTIDAQGNVTTSKTEANEMILNKGKDNQITLNENGIKVGTNSSVMDKDGVYTGGDTYNEAKAALKSDGSIKGADGKFTVNSANGTVNVNDQIELNGATGVVKSNGLNVGDGNMTVSNNGNINTVGTLSVADGNFKVNGNGGVSAAGGKTTLASDGSIKAADGKFTVNSNGGVKAADGKITLSSDGSVKAADGKFTVNSNGGVKAADGKITLSSDGSVKAADGKFTVDTNGAVKAANGNTTIDSNGNVKTAGTLSAADDSFKVDSTGKITSTGLDAGNGTIQTTGTVQAGDVKTGTLETTGNATIGGDLDVKGDLAVEGEFNAKTLSSKLDENNYTTINGGKTQSVNLKMNTATGETQASASTFDETGSNMWAKDDDSIGKSTVTADGISQKLSDTGDNPTAYAESTMSQGTDNKYTMTDTVKDGDKTNVASQSATESSDVVTDVDGNTSTFRQKVDSILQEINNAAGDTLTKVEQTDTAITSQIGDGSAVKSEMTADGITNTAVGGTITNSAKDLVNTATGDMTNTVGGKMLNDVTGDMENKVGGNLTTTVGGNETHSVKGNQTNTVSGDRTVNVKGTETENFNAQVTNVKTDQRTSVGGNQTNIVAGNQQNTVSGSKTETVKGSVTEKYGSQATTVDGDQSTHVGGNQSNVVAGDQTNTISGSKTESVKGAVTETYGSQSTTVNGDQSTTVKGNQSNTVEGTLTETVTGDVTEDYKANLSTTVGGNQTTTVTGDSSLTAENITNEAKNKITNKALDVETDASSSIVSKVSNEYGSNTSTQLSYQTTEEMSQADGKKASYLRGAAEEKSQLTDGDKKTTIDTIAGQTNTNITDGTNISNSLQKADQIASSVTDGTNTTVVDQKAGSLASSITDGTKANNTNSTVDNSEQLIKASDTQYSATTKTATKTEDALVNGSTLIDIVKDSTTGMVSSAVTDGNTSTGISQSAKDISLSAGGGTIANAAQNITNTASESITNTVGKTTVTTTDSGTTFENTDHNTAIKDGTITKTTISGNTLTTGQATMDYAEVMKDLGVHGNATVDQKLTVKGDSDLQGNANVGKNLTVNGTSDLKGDVTMESNATVKKDLVVEGKTTTNELVVNKGATVTGGTTTDTLHVTSTSTFDGAATFKDAVTMEKDLSVGGNATVAGSMTASSYKVGDKTYIDSTGINANNQKIVNVAAGDLSASSTDAVNGSQLYQTNERVASVENRVDTVENRVSNLDSRVDKVGANAAALANLHPLEFDADSKWNIAAAVGGYKGETATAIGAFYRPNENVMVNVSSSFGTGENMYGGGISLRIGQGGNKARRNATNGLTEREKAQQKQIDYLTSRLDALLSVINPNMSKAFPDVPENHWAYEAVSRLAGNGIIQGYEDGKYHGERTMTRYEMAEIIYNALSKGAKAEKKLVEEFKPELQAMAAQKKA